MGRYHGERMVVCAFCNKGVWMEDVKGKYCSNRCRQQAYRSRNAEKKRVTAAIADVTRVGRAGKGGSKGAGGK